MMTPKYDQYIFYLKYTNIYTNLHKNIHDLTLNKFQFSIYVAFFVLKS